MYWPLLLLGSILAVPEVRPLSIGSPAPDFSLRDHRGAVRRLDEWQDSKLVVIAFLGADCPLVKLYTPRLNEIAKEYGPRGAAVIGINANQHDQIRDIARFVRDHAVSFPILKDSDNRVADLFGALRTPEVFLLDGGRKLRYRGRIDDQYGVGLQRPRPTRRDLVAAIEELLAGKEVSQPATTAPGCFIDRLAQAAKSGRVTYHQDVAPILHQHCIACHRPRAVAPFALLTYKQTIGWADTIREVIEEGRMPPWHANPKHGKFLNDPRLSEEDKKTIAAWVEAGCPEGPAASWPDPPLPPEGWSIPEPDAVVMIPQEFTVPAEGVIEYQYFIADPGFTEDRWVKAAEIRPGNRAVVHHCTVFLVPPGMDEPRASGRLGSHCLAATAPGTPPLLLPDDMAKRVPAGSKLLFVLHYTPTGVVQTDRTSIGLVFADPQSVRKEVATHLLYDEELRIPPRASAHRVEKTWTAPGDMLLLALFPHMHLRGKSFRYEAELPDGTVEVLLDVPRYDFNWQHRYVLAEPRPLPKGTVIRAIGVYDNSAANQANPDPEQEVRAGKQTWEEMFNGYFEWCLAEDDPASDPSFGERLRNALLRPLVLLPLLGCVVLLVLLRRRSRLR